MTEFQAALPHGPLEEVFPGVFFVTGTMRGEFFGSIWQFSRNMTVVRENGRLTIVNSVRLNDDGLRHLDSLGTVANIVRIGDMHGVDDPFYQDRYPEARFWAMPGMDIQDELSVDHELREGGEMPFSNCSFFAFTTTKLPEGILILDREGGIAIACDALQNWVAPDEFFDAPTVETMTGMGFFTRANLGLAWLHESQPQAEDFVRLKNVPFAHALCGHGVPLHDSAQQEFHAAFTRFFQV